MNIFKQLIVSLYSPKDIAKFHQQGIGKTILFVFFLTLISVPTHGRPEAQNIQEKEAGSQHAQGSARDCDPEVSALSGDEAAPPRLRGVRVLRG